MFDQKKSLHINLSKNLYNIFKLELYSHEISNAEFFTMITKLLSKRDSRIIELINEYKENKLDENLENIENLKMKDVYDAIERNSPFKE